ncbi:MAG: hypothetical protein EOP54_15380 [Sphingobacteriales bacterium]|nr:MAG: hypothetical protein EOP54_15380 [Sphingobacteriales bacterium]
MMKKTGLLLALGFFQVTSYSQQNDNYFKTLSQNITAIAQAPNSASLGKYGEYPVNENVGLPGISIPVYEVNVGNIRFPIDISYHASGIRVADVASWVGLGFSLNAGGMITRRVVGLPDDLYTSSGKEGFFYKYGLIAGYPGTMWEINQSYPQGLPFMELKLAVDEGRTDYMPDVFSYNFAGKSGTFTLQPQNGIANNLKALTIPYDDIDIQATMPVAGKLSSFMITDDNGLKYTFNQVEVNYDNLSTTHPSPAPTGDESINTSWYISSISDPKSGAAVNFTYEVDSIETDKHWSYQKTDLYIGTCSYTASLERNSFSRIKSLRLKEINYAGTKIVFNVAAAARQDVLNARSLESVSVFINNELISNTKLVTNYFGSGANPQDKRLKLEKVQLLEPVSAAVVGEYAFDYNSSVLPSRTSTEQDLWGFYRPGALQFPVKTVVHYNGGFTFRYSSDSRMPNSSTAASSLKKITYPTGGYSLFNFENNTYHRNDPIYQIIPHTNATPANTQQYAQEITTPFTINQTTLFDYEAIVSPSRIFHTSSGSPLEPCTNTTGGSATLFKVGQSSPIRTFMQNETGIDFQLQAGTYYFQSTIIEQDCLNAMVRLNLREKKIIGYGINYAGPGLRIGSIENFDPYSNQTQKTQYLYENDAGKSSGVLYNTPKVVNQWSAVCNNGAGLSDTRYYTSYFNDQSITGGSIGPNIFYRQVSKKYVGANNGKVTNLYSINALPFGSMLGGSLFSMANTFRNGQLLQSTTYDEAGATVNSTKYEFSFLPAPSNYGFYAFKSIANYMANLSDELSVTKYEIESGIKKINREIITDYLDGAAITKTIDYSYNRPEQARPSRIAVTFNDGTKLVTDTKYATDYTVPTSGTLSASLQGIKAMQEQRIYDIPLESYQTSIDNANQSVVTEANYMEVAASPVGAPKSIYSLKLADAITNFTPSAVNGITLSKDNRYTLDFEAHTYQSGLPTSFTVNNEYFQKKYFHPLYKLPAVIASGTNPGSVSFTSFEQNTALPWSGSNFTYINTYAATGSSAAQLSGGSLSLPGLDAGQAYLVSFYALAGASISVNGTLLTGTFPQGTEWARFQTVVSGVTSIQVSGSGIIDELRLSEASNRFQTLTYNNKRQLTTICDDKNQITRFDYDALGRLISVKDADGKLLKTHQYRYQGAE